MPESKNILKGSFCSFWFSPWVRWVGFRYLKSKKNSKFLSFITLISIAGVGLGVTALIVVLSVMDGFEHELESHLMNTDLHLLITPTSQVEGFDGGFVPKQALEKTKIPALLKSHPNVLEAWSVLGTEAILRTSRKVTGVVVKGVTSERITRLKKQVTEFSQPQLLVEKQGAETLHFPSLFLGQELAFEMGILPGDFVTLVSPTETEGPMGSVPRIKKFVIEGIYHSGLPEQELHTVFTEATHVSSFLRRAHVISHWEVTLKNFKKAPELGLELKGLAPLFKIQDWMELNSHLFSALRLERISMFIVLAFIIIVASFNIVTTLTLMVLEKKKEISILKAMGAQDSEIAGVFLSEGLLIGVLGILGGCGLGYFLCFLLSRYDFIQLPEIYYDRKLPVTFDPYYYGIVILCSTLIVLVACLYPAYRASRLNPIDGIRYG